MGSFSTPVSYTHLKEVCDVIAEAGKFGIFGYAGVHDDYFEAIHAWICLLYTSRCV